MSEATTRAYIESVVEGVSNVGSVHDYQRWAVKWPDFLSRFKVEIGGSDVIRGWTIALQSFTSEYLIYPNDDGNNIVIRDYVYKIRGYFGLDDAAASEKTAMAVVEDVIEALDADTTLHAQTEFWDETSPAHLDTFEPRMFGSVLCHYAEITQHVKEEIAQQ